MAVSEGEEYYNNDWVKEQSSTISTKASTSGIMSPKEMQRIDYIPMSKITQSYIVRPRKSSFGLNKNELTYMEMMEIIQGYLESMNNWAVKKIEAEDEEKSGGLAEAQVSSNTLNSIKESIEDKEFPYNRIWEIDNFQKIDDCFDLFHKFASDNYFQAVHSTMTRMKIRRVFSDNILKVMCNFCFMTSNNYIDLQLKQMDNTFKLTVFPQNEKVLKYVQTLQKALWQENYIELNQNTSIRYFVDNCKTSLSNLARNLVETQDNDDQMLHQAMHKCIKTMGCVLGDYLEKEKALTKEGKVRLENSIFEKSEVNKLFQKHCQHNERKLQDMKKKIRSRGFKQCLKFLQINQPHLNIQLLPFKQPAQILSKLNLTYSPSQKLSIFKSFFYSIHQQSSSYLSTPSSIDSIIPVIILTFIYSDTTNLYSNTKLAAEYAQFYSTSYEQEIKITTNVELALDYIRNSFIHYE